MISNDMEGKRNYLKTSILLVVICFQYRAGCGQVPVNNANQGKSLFSLLTPDQTGISFKNTVTDTKKDNILIYQSFYKGGGVGIGDINNDGLADVYFTGNQVGDRLYLNQGNLQFCWII